MTASNKSYLAWAILGALLGVACGGHTSGSAIEVDGSIAQTGGDASDDAASATADVDAARGVDGAVPSARDGAVNLLDASVASDGSSAAVGDTGTESDAARDADAAHTDAALDAGSASDAARDANAEASAATLPRYADFTGVCAYNESDFVKLQALGIKHARMDLPSAALIEKARTYGIEVLPIADYGFPDLSGQNDQMYPPLPENRAVWAKRMVDTWRNMAVPPRVLEVWNEPWVEGFWKPMPDAAAYLELVKAFAKEAWSVWPEATLLVSADSNSSRANYDFRTELLKADSAGFLNDPRILPTTHNYVEGRTPTEKTPQQCLWDLDRFDCAYKAFKAHGHPNPQVWVTEFGWESNTAGGTNAVMSVSEALQADYTKAALTLFRSSGKVARAYAFLFRTNDKWNYNWLRPDNSQKPVCESVKQLLAQ